MKVLIQRVKQASVKIDNKFYSSINKGILAFVGIEKGDNIEVRANDGMTPLMIASLRQKSSAVKFFLSKGASFTKQDMEAVLKQISKEEMVEAGYYWDLHDAIFR